MPNAQCPMKSQTAKEKWGLGIWGLVGYWGLVIGI